MFKDILKLYDDSFSFIKESKYYIYTIISVFLVTAIFSFLVPTPDVLSEALIQFINELVLKTEGLSVLGLSSFIFLNNLQSSFFGLFLGVLIGIFPIIVALINGYLLGFVASIVVQETGFFSLWRLLPHGIIELAAVFISLGMGMKLGTFVFKKDKKKALMNYLRRSLKTFFLVILPMLLVAAIIESILIAFIP